MIAACMTYFVRLLDSQRSYFSATDRHVIQLLASGGRLVTSSTLIVRLVYLVVETGMFTGKFACFIFSIACVTAHGNPPAVAALIDLILFYGFPQRAYHGTVALTLAKL